MYSPLDEKWLYDGDLPVEPEGFSLEFCAKSPEEQAQVISDVADDLEKNWKVVMEEDEDGCMHPHLYPKEA